MFSRGLKAKILTLTAVIIIAGFAILVFFVIKNEKDGLMRERYRASELMAEPILHTIYKDMLEERADMTRFLIEGLKTIKGVERVQIIRSNGVEEAFQDYKTLRAVEPEFGELKPEWLVDHPNKASNIAEGIWNPDFKQVINQFNTGVLEAAHYIEVVDEKRLFTYLVPIEYRQKCSACHVEESEARGLLMISTSADEMFDTLAHSRNRWILHGIITVIAVVLLLNYLIGAIVIRPVERTVDMLRGIVEGKGDLTRRLDMNSTDEIGMLGQLFNKFADGMQGMVKGVFGASTAVLNSSKKVEASSRDILSSVQKQLTAADEMAGSIEEMDASIKSVAEDADALNISSKKVLASAQAMYKSTDDLKFSNEKLVSSAGKTSLSINQMAEFVDEADDLVGDLSGKTEQVVSAILDIGTKVKEIQVYSAQQADLAEKVRIDAEDLGMGSIVKVREGIEKVSEEVGSTAAVIDRLGVRSREIGNILNVINDFADTTQLLALNATILAAQAGEHGKGFAVVARQVKDLASKTANSTKEISELINQVQNEVSIAVESMHRSSRRVEEGVRLSRAAQEGFTKILVRATLSFDKAKLVETTTVNQTKSVSNITDAAQVINFMVNEIKKITDEQKLAASGLQEDTVDMRDLIEKIKVSTNEQSVESRLAGDMVFKVAEKIQRVAEATSEQMKLSDRIIDSMEIGKNVAEDNATHAFGLDKTVKELNKLADLLRSNVGSYKT